MHICTYIYIYIFIIFTIYDIGLINHYSFINLVKVGQEEVYYK